VIPLVDEALLTGGTCFQQLSRTNKLQSRSSFRDPRTTLLRVRSQGPQPDLYDAAKKRIICLTLKVGNGQTVTLSGSGEAGWRSLNEHGQPAELVSRWYSKWWFR
jgi:hypothetical protein